MFTLKTKICAVLLTLISSIAIGQQAVVDTTVFAAEALDTIPIYAGGKKEMFNMISRNLNFPPVLRQQVGTIGTAFISFVVDEKGQLVSESLTFALFSYVTTGKEPKTKRILDESKLDDSQKVCVAEAKRVVLFLKKWTPAQINGMPVKCRLSLPLTFKNEGVVNRR
jgi:hypothetical protein